MPVHDSARPPLALGERISREAEALIGAPFRLHGRREDTGIDCIGLVALAIARARGVTEIAIPFGYRLRNSDTSRWLPFAQQVGLAPVCGPMVAGDVIHVSPGPGQDHLLIVARSGGYIHAHAGFRRVVLTPGLGPCNVLNRWRATQSIL